MKGKNPNETKEEKRAFCYIEADKPLVYNFFDVKTLSELLDKEPTSGKRKENKKKEENEEKNEGINEVEKEKNLMKLGIIISQKKKKIKKVKKKN